MLSAWCKTRCTRAWLHFSSWSSRTRYYWRSRIWTLRWTIRYEALRQVARRSSNDAALVSENPDLMHKAALAHAFLPGPATAARAWLAC